MKTKIPDDTKDFMAIIRGFSNNEQAILKELITKEQDEIATLLIACRNIIIKQCCKTILEKGLGREIKIKLLEIIKNKIETLQNQQLTKVLSSKLELYETQEQKEIEQLSQLSIKIGKYDYKEMIDKIMATLIKTNIVDMIQIQERKEELTKEKLRELSYDNKLCVSENQINEKVIAQICKDIIESGLRDIAQRVEKTLENDKKFNDLRAVKEAAKELVSEYYIAVLEEKIKKITEDLKTRKIIKRINKRNNLSLIEIRKKLTEMIRFKMKIRKEEIEDCIKRIDTIYELEKQIEERKQQKKKNLTPEQQELYMQTQTYKDMQERKTEDSIERLEDVFIERIKEEINHIARKLSNSITEKEISNEQEQKRIEESAEHLNIPVQRLTRILSNDENIYLFLISTWLTNEIRNSVKTPEHAILTMREISPEEPQTQKQLANIVMGAMNVPPAFKEITASSIKQIGIPDTKGKKPKRKRLNERRS